MHKGRLEAFTDGVIAIIITIMVLEIKLPQGAGFEALAGLLPVFGCYLLSFTFVAIYWNNHHHMFQAVERVSGPALWANMHLLFWLSLVPFVTNWMGENSFAPAPTALYGAVMLMCGFAYFLLTRALLTVHSSESAVAVALGNDFKGKISLVLYLVAVPLAFVSVLGACLLYILVAVIWIIPDRRFERVLSDGQQKN